MIPFELAKLIIDDRKDQQMVVLKEKGGEKFLPIMIGFVEASGIQMKLGGVTPPRPLTHDLLTQVLQSLEVKVEHVLIDDLVEGTFFAKLQLRTQPGEVVIVDCRPSDGIAVAIRLQTPIFVDQSVLDKSMSQGL
jgi:bifunctional DNase/RNase